MSHARRWILAVAALPLLYLPLRAAEAPPATPPESPAPSAPADDTAKPSDEKLEEVSGARETPPRKGEADPGDRLSLDNNLSFPVDI